MIHISKTVAGGIDPANTRAPVPGEQESYANLSEPPAAKLADRAGQGGGYRCRQGAPKWACDQWCMCGGVKAQPAIGCICPPGADLTCQGPTCPRRPIITGTR